LTGKECIEIAKAIDPTLSPTVQIFNDLIAIKDDERNTRIDIETRDETHLEEIVNKEFRSKQKEYAFNHDYVKDNFACYLYYYTNPNENEYHDISESAKQFIISILTEKEKLYNELNCKIDNYDLGKPDINYLDFFSEGEIEKMEINDWGIFFDHPRYLLIIKKMLETNYPLTPIRNAQDFYNALKYKYSYDKIQFTSRTQHDFDELIELYKNIYCNIDSPNVLIYSNYSFDCKEASLKIEKMGFLFSQTIITISKLETIYQSRSEYDVLNALHNIETAIGKKIKQELESRNSVKENEFQIRKKEVITDLDKNQDGKIDIISEEDFMKILSENQTEIINIERRYTQDFVKVSNYLKTKRSNIQTFFQSLKNSSKESDFESKETALKNQIYSYQLLLFHAISMITALLEDNMIVFYEIYEAFDKLSIFNSNWENDVSKKLVTIDNKLNDLITSINKVEYSISQGLDNLSYVTQNSFNNFQTIMDEYLESIDSSIRTNNLLNLIQIYQLHNVNKHAKSIERNGK